MNKMFNRRGLVSARLQVGRGGVSLVLRAPGWVCPALTRRTVWRGLVLLVFAGRLVATESWDLEGCIAYGMTHATVLQEARLMVADRAASIAQARARFDPTVSLGADRDLDAGTQNTRLRLVQELPAGFAIDARAQGIDRQTDGAQEEALSYHIALTKSLLDGGSYAASMQGIDEARIDEAIARNEEALQRRLLQRDICRDFYLLIRRLRTRDIASRRVETARRNLELARERDRLIDITNAEIQVASASDALLSAEFAISEARDQLKRRIGLSVTGSLSIDPRIADDLEAPAQAVEDDIAYALSHYEGFLNRLLELRRLALRVRIASAGRLPELTLSAGIGQEAEARDYQPRDEIETTLGLDFTWPLGERRDRARWLRATIAEERAQLQLADAREDKRRELRQLARDLEEAYARIELAEQRLAARGRLVELYQDRYDNGEIDILELVRSQDEHEGAKVALLDARLNYLSRRADYRFALGR